MLRRLFPSSSSVDSVPTIAASSHRQGNGIAGECELAAITRGDYNGEGETNGPDASPPLDHLFVGEATIPAPGPETCGDDPTEDELSCESFPPCD